MNYLDYLSGEPQVPQNYVQPLSDQGLEVPQYEAPPVVSEAPPIYVNPAAGIRNMVSSSANYAITPQVRPLVTPGGEVMAADNPWAIGGPDYIAPTPVLPVMNISGSLQKKQAPYSNEMDKAIGISQSAIKKMENDVKPYQRAKDEYDMPLNTMDNANSALEKEANAYAEGTNNIMATYGQEQEKLNQDFQAINNDFIERSNKITQGLNDLIDEKIDPTIDPGRFWSNASTGQKIAMSIGLIFSAMTPETNKLAIDSVTKAIERDIDAQKQTIIGKMAERRDKISSKNMLFDNAYKITNNQQAAIEAMRARSYQQAAMMVDQMSKKLNSRESLANAQQAKAQLELSAMTARQNAHNAAIDQSNKQAEMMLNARMNEAQLRVAKAKIMSDEKIAFSTKGAQAGQLGAWAGDPMSKEIETKTMFAPAELKKKAIEERASLDEAEEMFNAIDRFYDEYNSWTETQKAWAEIPGTDEYNFVKKAPSLLFQPATELAKGALQGFEFESTIVPYIPRLHQSQKAINTNKNTFKNLIYGKLKGKTPTLKHYGVSVENHYPAIRKLENQRPK